MANDQNANIHPVNAPSSWAGVSVLSPWTAKSTVFFLYG